jgi:RND family efflux transporter MFP subunit
VVAARLAAEHGSINRGQPVLRLHDLSEVRVEISVPERLVAGMGDLSSMTFEAALPEGRVALRLVAFQPEAERVGQSFRVVLALPAGAGQALLPGASVTVTVAVPSETQGIPVPAAALLAGNDRSAAVLVLEEAAGALRVRHHPVTVLATTGAGFVVEGLPEGVEIVAAGAHRLTDGQEVRRFAQLLFAER